LASINLTFQVAYLPCTCFVLFFYFHSIINILMNFSEQRPTTMRRPFDGEAVARVVDEGDDFTQPSHIFFIYEIQGILL
jgi:hypothetical protein